MSLAADPRPNFRLPIAIAVSLAVNVVLWSAASNLLNRRIHAESPHLTFERVVIDKKTGVKRIKLPKPKPILKPKAEPLSKPPRPVVPRETKPPSPPPPAAHNMVVTAKVTPATAPSGFTAPTGGKAPPGLPTVQGPSDAPPASTPPPSTSTPTPPPTAPPTAPPPTTPTAPPVAPPKAPPPPPPAPPPPPKPAGPTKDAEPVNMVDPEIPETLKSEDLRAFVHVKVTVHPDGSFDVVLRTSSHNSEVDKLVLDALKRWRWKPALEDGQPIESTKLFKFEFEVK